MNDLRYFFTVCLEKSLVKSCNFQPAKICPYINKYIHILTYIKRTKNQQTNVLKYVRE